MSNLTLKTKIIESLSLFRAGEISLSELKSSIQENGRALEMMSYVLIKEIDDIECQLTVSEFADEEECYASCDQVLIKLDHWLERVPV